MRQHSVDLLPESLRARTRARNAKGRNLIYASVGGLIIAASAVHARLLESRAEGQLSRLRTQAEQLALNEQSAQSMHVQLERLTRQIHRYRQIEVPLEVTRILATVIEVMPESATIERIDMDTDRRERGARNADAKRNRRLVAEISGFARTDLDIAAFVGALAQRDPFESVSLDFSRQRTVHDLPAREFRMSFVIDLERHYQVVDPDSAAGKGEADAD